MRYRPLGKTGIVLSEIGLGSHMFPTGEAAWYEGYYGKRVRENVSYGERRGIIEAALSHGVSLIAAEGGQGFEAETGLTGRILADLGAREGVVLLGLTDFRPESYAEADWRQLEAQLDALLERLGTPWLDVLELRVTEALLDSPFPLEFHAQAERLKEGGKIRATAVYASDREERALIRAARTGCFDAICRPLGFLNPRARESLIPVAREMGLGFIAFVPFQKGWFFECAAEAGLMADGGAAVASAGLRWCLAEPNVTSVLVGVSSVSELEANCAAADTGGASQRDHDLLQALTQTHAYDRLINMMREGTPEIVFDWRGELGIRSLPPPT